MRAPQRRIRKIAYSVYRLETLLLTTQQVCHNFGIAGGMVVSDALSIETPLCFLSGKRANNPVMVAPNASSC